MGFSIKHMISALAVSALCAAAFAQSPSETVSGEVQSQALNASVLSGNALRTGHTLTSGSLSGRIPGLLVMQTSAVPGDGASLWIRGVRTSGTDSSPLVYVDGVECDIDLVDPADIEDISVLKDASATVLYGLRGANGVILIRTKRGFESKPKVKASFSSGMVTPIHMPQVASTGEWLDYYNEMVSQEGGSAPFTASDIANYTSGTSPDLYPSVNWIEESFRTLASTSKANISATGGSSKVHYYISAAYNDCNGLLAVDRSFSYSPQINYRKFSFRSNVDIDLSKYTVLSLRISSQYRTTNSPVSSISTIMGDALSCSPVAMPKRWSDGSLSQAQEYGTVNPYNDINSQGYKRSSTMYAQSGITLLQDLTPLSLKGLRAKLDFTWAVVNGNTLSRYCNPIYYYLDPDSAYTSDGELNLRAKNNGSNYLTLSKSVTSNTTITLEPALLYDRSFGDHSLSAALLFDLRYRTENVPVSYLYSYPYKYMNFGGRVGYSYKNRYAVDLAASYSGSDNFEKGKRWGVYPAVAAEWNISEEGFWSGVKSSVDVLKIRGSYGLSGSDQTGSYSRRFVFNSTLDTYASSATFGNSGQYSPNGIVTQYTGYPDLGMERSVKADIGLYARLFGELSFSAELYSDRREGIYISDQSTPSVAGLTYSYLNAGEMLSRGIELSVSYTHNFGKDFGIDVYAIYAFNRSRLLADGKPEQAESYMNAVGHPYGQQFGLIAEGLFSSDEEIASAPVQKFGDVNVGDIRYKDLNGDNVVDYRDVTAIGYSTVPETNYSFGLTARLRRFDLSADFGGVANVTRLLSGTCIKGGADNALYLGQIYSDVAQNRWTLSNQDSGASYPRMYLEGCPNNSVPSTLWQRDMSYFRLKNVELGYSFPKNVRIFLNAGNLFTLSKFKLWDPELGTNSGAAYPMTASLIFGLNLNF